MKNKTWFRLVLRAIGVLMIVSAMPDFIGMVIQGFYNVLFGPSSWGMGGSAFWELLNWNLSQFVSSFLQTVFGFYLFFGGKRIVNMCIPSNKTYCPECGYDMGRSGSVMCPECGVRVRAVEAPPVVG